MQITGKEIAMAVGKTPAAISYLKKKHQEEFSLLRLGVLCKKFGISDEDIEALLLLKGRGLHKAAVAYNN